MWLKMLYQVCRAFVSNFVRKKFLTSFNVRKWDRQSSLIFLCYGLNTPAEWAIFWPLVLFKWSVKTFFKDSNKKTEIRRLKSWLLRLARDFIPLMYWPTRGLVTRAYGFSWNHSVFTTHSDLIHFLFLIKLEKCYFGEWSQCWPILNYILIIPSNYFFMICLRYTET